MITKGQKKDVIEFIKDLKKHINPSRTNEYYQKWAKQDKSSRGSFSNYVIYELYQIHINYPGEKGFGDLEQHLCVKNGCVFRVSWLKGMTLKFCPCCGSRLKSLHFMEDKEYKPKFTSHSMVA